MAGQSSSECVDNHKLFESTIIHFITGVVNNGPPCSVDKAFYDMRNYMPSIYVSVKASLVTGKRKAADHST